MSACPNCGNNQGYKEKDNCEKCGYLKPVLAKLEDGTLIYCSGCGCTYINTYDKLPCSHDASYWQKVKL
jgi:hypothetical protein